ncbi:hypothetical protein O181_122612 [Austropuccinia psidii MF-1]|uniref:Retrotransposon gag domain-containing protein n=1 Tax=Austropuccinia psidii MF-1 TaxID=1389203 RepID=A0A9Q3KL65_9BASI|nr:hypothetical protein [Austropuccinia psidii MF-1]
MKGAAPSKKEGRGPRSISLSGVVGGFPGNSRTSLKVQGEADDEEEESSVEEKESDGTEGVPATVGASQSTGGLTLAQSDEPVSHQYEPYLLAIMHGRAAKFIEPYLSNLTNQDSNYLLNSWLLFESQLFTLFGDPNEVRKAEVELDSLIMKEGGQVSLYIADFKSLVSRIGDWGERALIHHFREGLPSRILDQLASQPPRIDPLQDLMDITLELDTRYHERQK